MIGAVIGWLPGGLTSAIGSPLAVLLTAVGGISGLAFSLMYKRYIGVLGAGGGRKGYPARDAYEGLRASLSGGNLASRLYADWLTKFLDVVDRFFGDAGKAGQTLFPRAFGLKTPAPLWTAPAFDRCLLLALIYPIVTIFVIWAVSGHVGSAGGALQLSPDISGWRRGISAGGVGISVLIVWNGLTTPELPSVRRLFWVLTLAEAAAFVAAFAANFLFLGFLGIVFIGVGISARLDTFPLPGIFCPQALCMWLS
jgi:hypothetical protein